MTREKADQVQKPNGVFRVLFEGARGDTWRSWPAPIQAQWRAEADRLFVQNEYSVNTIMELEYWFREGGVHN
ncbi:MAG: hypothetical protein CMI16_03165 [Opitutaceae bacterium]|nr:hypothetical protein [Opitutaceae bacterium]